MVDEAGLWHSKPPAAISPGDEKAAGRYVLTLGGERVYIPGDTEDHEDMPGLKDIDIAFLPMNNYLHGEEHLAFTEAMREHEGIEMRMRDWYAGP